MYQESFKSLWGIRTSATLVEHESLELDAEINTEEVHNALEQFPKQQNTQR